MSDTYIAVNYIKGAKIEVNYHEYEHGHIDYVDIVSTSGKIKTELQGDSFHFNEYKDKNNLWFCCEIIIVDKNDNEYIRGYPIGYAKEEYAVFSRL